MTGVKTVSLVAVSFGAQTLVSVIFYLVIARTLPVTEVGAIALFLSLEAIFFTIFSLNLDTGFIHFISYFQEKNSIESIPRKFILLSVLTIIFSLTSISAASGIIATVFFHSIEYEAVVNLLGIFVAETIGIGYLVSFLQGMQHFSLAAIANLLYSLFSMGIAIVLSLFSCSIFEISSGFVVGGAFTLLLAVIFVKAAEVDGKEPDLKLPTFFRYVIPIYLGSLFSGLMATVDRIILPALTNLTLSAVYTYSLTIATIVTAMTSPFSFFILPKISQHFAVNPEEGIKKYGLSSLELFYYLALPVSIGGAIISKPLLSFLVGGIYAKQYQVLQIMIFSYAFFSVRPILSSMLLGVRKTGVYLWSGIGAFAANLSISILFIPHYGIYGAITASISAWAVSTLPRMIAVNRLANVHISIWPYIRIWINTGIMALAVIFLFRFVFYGNSGLFPTVVSGILIYLAISRINIPFSITTLDVFKEIVSRRNRILFVVLRLLFGIKNIVSI